MEDRTRASLGFEDVLADFDPAEFTPAPPARPKPAPELARALAEHTGFRSREAAGQGAGAAAAAPVAAPAASVPVRRRRTGRNAQFNLKARPETIAAYCAIADAHGWGLGETLEYAVALLQREHGAGG